MRPPRRRSRRSSGSHPTAKTFVEAPKPIPVSFARQAFFAVTAFKFTNAAGATRFGRFRLLPEAGTAFLTDEQAAAKTTDFLAAEMSERLAAGPATFRIRGATGRGRRPSGRRHGRLAREPARVEFGTLTIRERVDELTPERRKIIFDPLPRVDGIDSAGDPLTEVRSDIYLLSGRRRRAAAAK